MVSVPVVLKYWTSLEATQARSIIEGIFAVSVLYSPLIPVIWILSGYDALKISLNDAKKESIIDRILLSITRLRLDGWFSVFPRVKSIIALSCRSRGFIRPEPLSYRLFAHRGVQLWLHQPGMTLVRT
jgi:hypothetical protein